MMEQKKRTARTRPSSARARRKKRARRRRILRRSLLCLATLLLVVLGGLYALAGVVFWGPSQTASDLLVASALETSALKFLPRLYLSQAEVEEALARNEVVPAAEVSDTSLIVIDAQAKEETAETPEIEVVAVTGPTYKGVMMIVRDPSRVFVGVCNDPLSKDKGGKRIEEITDQYQAVAALNGGGFEDTNGHGNGGTPIGIVVSRGATLSRYSDSYYETTIGFDQDDKLVIGRITAAKAEEMHIRDAVQFGPALVVNGEASKLSGQGSGLNPRSAIGQRADGAVLLLAIDGRQVNSLGASMSDLIDVMLEFGAVNAANLDGGSSTSLYYEGEFLNEGTAVTGGRRICTAFLVS